MSSSDAHAVLTYEGQETRIEGIGARLSVGAGREVSFVDVTVLREHADIGKAYGDQDLAHDVRLACHGLDKNDNDFIVGLVGPRLHPLSIIVQRMRQRFIQTRVAVSDSEIENLLSSDQITQVEIGNVPDFVTHVEIPEHRLREYNLTLGQVAAIIRQSAPGFRVADFLSTFRFAPDAEALFHKVAPRIGLDS